MYVLSMCSLAYRKHPLCFGCKFKPLHIYMCWVQVGPSGFRSKRRSNLKYKIMLQIVNAIAIPQSAKGGNGKSKYLSQEIIDALNAVEIGQGFQVPVLPKVTPAVMKSNTAWYVKRMFGTTKTFEFGIVADQLVINCVGIEAAQDAE